jgi:putative PIN family toxin of toxin-antitoxin system
MNIVVDTNVIVSGLISPFGPPAQIVRMIASGKVSLCYDSRILVEYRDVLLRPKFPFAKEFVEALLDQITATGIIVVGTLLESALPDTSDEPFLEIALAEDVPLVTGNVKHFPKKKRQGALVFSPSEFIAFLRRHP